MNFYRISKYNPVFRVDGVYTKPEWTSIADIGKTYAGQKFSRLDYDAVLSKYVNFVVELARELNAAPLCIGYLENPDNICWQNGMILSDSSLMSFVTDCLSERCWGQLHGIDFIWETGYDFYMHCGCVLGHSAIEEIAKSWNLYVEPWNKICVIK